GFAVVNYIKSLGFNNIDAVIGTHPHEDHIGGMDEVVDNFDIGSIYLPKKTTTTKTFKDLLNSIKNKNLKIKSAAAGVNIDLDPALKIQMFAPNSSDYKDLNNYSAVIKITYESTAFLLEGDAESISEHEMLEKGYNLKADVLKVGHHGSSSSTSEKFLEAVKPNYAVISLGADNEYGHPHRETLEKLSAAKVKVYRTDEQGTIIAQSDGSSIKFNID
ncbi:MAG: ComEC/Rec2 family competence protein, partial [Bacillota bacterium]|nr:ComEC/Rec2 family competence protein [Bacillota bacterium]